MLHYANQSAYDFRVKNQDGSDIQGDMRNSWGIEWIWGGVYRLVKGVRHDVALPGKAQIATQIVNAPLMHIEILNLGTAEYKRYASWFNSVGSDIFIPLFMETTELMGWDLLEWTGNVREYFKVKEYPTYLSLLYFQSIDDFNDFEKSPALAAFKRAVKQILPEGISYKWYVQYRLWDIHRKEVLKS